MAYITEAEAITYFAGTLNEAAWTAIDVARKPLLLESASQYIDVAFSFTGTQSDDIVAFPRTECVNNCTGNTYADEGVPEAGKTDNAEIALKRDRSTELATGTR